MAFGQTRVIAFYSWGVAPGYGEKWPSAKRTQLRVPIWRITAFGETDLPLFAAVLRAGGWTNLGGQFGPPTRVGADDRGHALFEIAVDVGPKCPSRTAVVTPARATAVLMSGKVWPIWGTDPRGRKTTYGEFAGQQVPYVM